MSKIYKYPFGKTILVTNYTTELTPHTFLNDGEIWEKSSVEFFFRQVRNDENPNPNIIDVGAQSGLFSLFAKYLPNSKFHSFEPYKPSYNQLNKNIKLNNITNVKTYNLALSNEECVKILNVPDHKGLNSFCENPLRFNEYEEVPVNTTTLDKLFYDKNIPVDYLKCDTEGWEYFVLQGGVKTIQKYKPKLFIEWNNTNMKQCNIKPEEFQDFIINTLNYKLVHTIGENRLYIHKDIISVFETFLKSNGVQFENNKIKLNDNIEHVKIDIGLSHHAPHSGVWLNKQKNLQVFGFEPYPEHIEYIKLGDKSPMGATHRVDIRNIEDGTFVLVPCALSDKEGKISFYITENDSGCSSLFAPKKECVGPTKEVIKVPVFTLKNFFDLFPWDKMPIIEYIKIDAQGSDLNIIKGAENYLKERVVFVTGEADGLVYKGAESLTTKSLVKYMKSIGFYHIKHKNTKDPTFINKKFMDKKNTYICQM